MPAGGRCLGPLPRGWLLPYDAFCKDLVEEEEEIEGLSGVRFFTLPLQLMEVQNREASKEAGGGDTSALEVRGSDQGHTNVMAKPRPLPSCLLLSLSSPVCLPHDSMAL